MATRLYFDSAATPQVSPAAISAEWEHTSQNAIRRLNRAKLSSAMATWQTTYDSADHIADQDALSGQFVSPSLAAQTIAAQTLTLAIRAFEDNAGNNLFVTYKVFLINSSGVVVSGGTILAIRRDGLEIPTTTLTSRGDSVTTTQVTSSAGDRICVEIGKGGLPVAAGGTQDHDGSMRFGDTGATDLDGTDGQTVDNVPWINFANTLTFQDQTVTPTTASLTLTGYAPTVTAGGGITVTPPTVSMVLTGYAPTVSTPRLVTPTTASLVLTGYAPTVTISNNVKVTPTTASLVLTGYAPTVSVSNNVKVTPTTASLVLTGYAPTVTISNNVQVTPTTASLVLTGYIPTVIADTKVTPTTASLVLTGYIPTVTTDTKITPTTASLVLTGYAPTVIADTKVTPTTASLTLTGYAPTVTVGSGITVTPTTALLVLIAWAPTGTVSGPGGVARKSAVSAMHMLLSHGRI